MAATNELTRSRFWPALTLAVATVLWFVPTFGRPFTEPIANALRTLHLVGDETDDDAAWFIGALVLRWIAAALLLLFVLTIERQPLSSLGLTRPRRKHLLMAASLALPVMMVGLTIQALVTGGQPDETTETSQIIESLSRLQLLHLIVNAAIVEELFFRGLLIERTAELTGSTAVAVAASFAIFVGSHVAGSGWTNTLTVVAVGTVFSTALYAVTRNLFPCITAHLVGNSPLLLAA